jgi:hypothetical protein
VENKSNWKEYVWGALIAWVGSTVAIYAMCFSCRSDLEKFLWNVLFSTICWITLWSVNNWLNHYLNQKISWIETPIKRLVSGVLATIFFTVLAVLVLIKSWELIWDVSFGDYDDIIINSLVITFFISLFFSWKKFFAGVEKVGCRSRAVSKRKHDCHLRKPEESGQSPFFV